MSATPNKSLIVLFSVLTLALFATGCTPKYVIPADDEPTALITVQNYENSYQWWVPAADYLMIAHQSEDTGEKCGTLRRVSAADLGAAEAEEVNVPLLADGRITYVYLDQIKGGLLGTSIGLSCSGITAFIPEPGKQYHLSEESNGRCGLVIEEVQADKNTKVTVIKAKRGIVQDWLACAPEE